MVREVDRVDDLVPSIDIREEIRDSISLEIIHRRRSPRVAGGKQQLFLPRSQKKHETECSEYVQILEMATCWIDKMRS